MTDIAFKPTNLRISQDRTKPDIPIPEAPMSHLEILRRGVDHWNQWRNLQEVQRMRFFGVDPHEVNLFGANLFEAELCRADLAQVNLGRANLHRANLVESNLTGTNLSESNLHRANLGRANLSDADLRQAIFLGTKLHGSQFAGALLYETLFINVDLSQCNGLDKCQHYGPSTIDFRTLQRSGPLPLAFLRGVGLPDSVIEYLPSLLEQPIQHYSCFISYSSKDEEFARRLHADLQEKGIRTWFAPEDLKIGDKLNETISNVIRLRDKLILILSEASVTSAWVRTEVQKALAEEEKRGGGAVLFPIRIDDAVMDTTEQWADDIRRTRHIGDFTKWKNFDLYRFVFERMLRDLRQE